MTPLAFATFVMSWFVAIVGVGVAIVAALGLLALFVYLMLGGDL